jgi:1-acylglycerone phosphate reductase
LEILTEHLRLEIEPFGVRVLSVVTGAVKSKGQTYFEDWSLPEGSIYKPIEEIVHQRANGIDGAKREPTMEYAKNVVEDIISGATGKVWRGAQAGSVKFGSSSLPQTFIVSCLIPQSKETTNLVQDRNVSKGTGIDQLP